MWPESFSVKAVNLVKKSITVTEIMNFFLRNCFLLAHPVYITSRTRNDVKYRKKSLYRDSNQTLENAAEQPSALPAELQRQSVVLLL